MWMKKRYILRWNGEQRVATVATRGDETSVGMDEAEPLVVDAVPVRGGRALSVRVGSRVHLVHLSGRQGGDEVVATLAGRSWPLNVLDELHALALESLAAVAGSGTLVADIPGVVVEVKVKPGQKVHQGEPIIVVEAMKMQNELVAGVTGTVTEVPVEPGQSVNPGEPLVVIEPEPGG
ncbi:MAG: biotin/lipoyl-containing protein [Candidatus Krumholzibacteriia bacterium]